MRGSLQSHRLRRTAAVAKFALLIGTDVYDDPHLAPLAAPLADVYALQSVLKRPDVGRFDDVKVLQNAPLASALRQIGTLFANKARNDLVLLYFSGHGVIDREGHLFLALNETRYDLLLGTAIPASFVKEVMDKSSSRRQVLILDCCHSGAFERGRKGTQVAVTEATFEVNGYGREVLTSSSATQYAFDGNEIHGEAANSLFTRFLIEGLRTGEAAPGSQGITVEQLYHYVHDRVVRATPGMTPQRWADRQQGTLVIAKNPNPWAKELLPELNELLTDDNPLIREGAIRVLGTWLVSDDRGKQEAARRKLIDLRSAEQHGAVRAAIDEVMGAAQRERERRAREKTPTRTVADLEKHVTKAERMAQSLQVELVEKDQQQTELAHKVKILEERLSDFGKALELEKQRRYRAEEESHRWQEATQQLRVRWSSLDEPKGTGPKPGEVFRDRLQDGTQGPEMVVVPAGTFLMGSPKTEQARYGNEGPQHEVTIAKPFVIGRYAVTFDEYDRFVRATDQRLPNDASWGQGARPVINVSWEEAVTYSQWLSKQTGQSYRLPTEAEWEYAARAGSETAYWWGNDIVPNRANCSGCGSPWDNQQTAPVGSFPPNPLGLYEVLGNVWEWVQDCWNGRYRDAPTDGTAWMSGDCSRRVIRGGSWSIQPRHIRSASRHWEGVDNRFSFLGFRLVRDL